MLKKSILALTTVGALTFFHSASALTLSESYNLALNNDLEYARAASTLESTNARANSAYSGILPNVGFAYDWKLQKDTSLPAQFEQHLSSVKLALQQNLFDMTSFLKLNIALKQKRQAETTFYTARQDLLNRVVSGYLAIVKANSSVSQAKKQIVYLEEILNSTKIKLSRGLASKMDQDFAEAKLSKARATLYGAEARLEKAVNDFKVVVGTQADLKGFYALSKTPSLDYPKDSMKAMAGNLSLKSLAMTVEIAKVGTEVGVAALFPTISLQAAVSNSPANTVQIGDDGWFDAHKLDKVYVGINLTIPIFTGGRIYNGIKEATANYKQASYSYNLAYQQLSSGFKSNLRAIKANEEIIKTFEYSYGASKRAYNAKKAAYTAGLASVTEYIDVANQLSEIEEGLNNARYDYISSVIQQKMLAGTLNEKDIQAIDKLLTVKETLALE